MKTSIWGIAEMRLVPIRINRPVGIESISTVHEPRVIDRRNERCC